MRDIIITFILVIMIATASFAGGGSPPPQQMAPMQPNVVVVNPDSGNFEAYLGALATLAAAGIGYLGVRYSRKKNKD